MAAGDVRGGPAREVLTLASGGFDGPAKALLFSASGRRLRTYTGLRNARRVRGAVAVVGRDLLLGSPGSGAAYVVSRP